MDQTKEPAGETLKAAGAYETILNEINAADKAAKAASSASDELATMVGRLIRRNQSIYKLFNKFDKVFILEYIYLFRLVA